VALRRPPLNSLPLLEAQALKHSTTSGRPATGWPTVPSSKRLLALENGCLSGVGGPLFDCRTLFSLPRLRFLARRFDETFCLVQ